MARKSTTLLRVQVFITPKVHKTLKKMDKSMSKYIAEALTEKLEREQQ